MDQESERRVASSDGIVPDRKDWTWTLERTCSQCGMDASSIPAADLASRVTTSTAPWSQVLTRCDVRRRPGPATWSPLEYACHVRDGCVLFTQRITTMLTDDHPAFANWDQDGTAIEDRYAEQDPPVVAAALAGAAADLAAVCARVSSEQWELTGHRSDGSQFTVLSLGRYGLHDLAHHLWDVGVEVP